MGRLKTISWKEYYTVIFFSSRRRHTRYWRDWSSDVCSSDLGEHGAPGQLDADGRVAEERQLRPGHLLSIGAAGDDSSEFFAVQGDPLRNGGTRSEERCVGKECRSRWSPYH